MELGDVYMLDAPMVIVVITVTILSSALSGFLTNFGWRSAAEREANLAKLLKELGGMDNEVEVIRQLLRERVRRADDRAGVARNFQKAFAARIPELAISTVITIAVTIPMLMFLGLADRIPLLVAASITSGLAIQVVSAAYIVRKNGGR